LGKTSEISGIPVLAAVLVGADIDTLRQMTDRFRQRYASGIVVLGSVYENRPVLIAAVTEDLVKKGFHAGELVKETSQKIGGSGGGRPNLAQAGGKNPDGLQDAIDAVVPIIKRKAQN
jgi:alanyl-tRNA synthetase